MKVMRRNQSFLGQFPGSKYCDVSLSTQDGVAAGRQPITAHRVVLAAVSDKLEKLVDDAGEGAGPVVVRNVKFEVLSKIVEYIYSGRVQLGDSDAEKEDFEDGLDMLRVKVKEQVDQDQSDALEVENISHSPSEFGNMHYRQVLPNLASKDNVQNNLTDSNMLSGGVQSYQDEVSVGVQTYQEAASSVGVQTYLVAASSVGVQTYQEAVSVGVQTYQEAPSVGVQTYQEAGSSVGVQTYLEAVSVGVQIYQEAVSVGVQTYHEALSVGVQTYQEAASSVGVQTYQEAVSVGVQAYQEAVSVGVQAYQEAVSVGVQHHPKVGSVGVQYNQEAASEVFQRDQEALLVGVHLGQVAVPSGVQHDQVAVPADVQHDQNNSFPADNVESMARYSSDQSQSDASACSENVKSSKTKVSNSFHSKSKDDLNKGELLFKCPICKVHKTSKSYRSLLDHCRRYHSKVAYGSKKVACGVCHQAVPEYCLELHHQCFHRSGQDNDISLPDQEYLKDLQEEMMTSKNKKMLRVRVMLHKMLTCIKCGGTFSNQSELHSHLETVHGLSSEFYKVLLNLVHRRKH